MIVEDLILLLADARPDARVFVRYGENPKQSIEKVDIVRPRDEQEVHIVVWPEKEE